MKETITYSDRLKMIKFIATTKKFTNSEMVKRFESEWNEWLGSQHSLFVSSGSTANFLLLAAVKEYLGLKDGDKVLVPACTWMTNVAPVIQLGLSPVFCDINLDNLSFDKKHMEYLSKQNPDIKLVFSTHLLGFPSWPTDTIKEYFPNAVVIDDVCESHGVSVDGKKVGENSVGATFSFYFGHHMTTIEGGMVSTRNEELYDLMKMKRSHGMSRESINPEFYNNKYPSMDPSFLFVTDGYNFRNHEIPAVLGSSQLKRLDKMIRRRQDNYKKFIDILSPHLDKFYMPYTGTGNSNFAFPLISKDTDVFQLLKERLDRSGVERRPVVSGNLLSHPFLNSYRLDYPFNTYPNVSILQNRGLYVGNNHFVGDKEISMLKDVLDYL
jgi:CDP-6-deoxy-D-xylo-4-hexulose-3-dehydrase